VRKALDMLYNAAGYLAAFFVFAIFVLMIAQTVMRETGMSFDQLTKRGGGSRILEGRL